MQALTRWNAQTFEPRRGCITQPRVARNELPWGTPHNSIYPEGVSSMVRRLMKRFQRIFCLWAVPQGSPDKSGQPWADLCNHFGVMVKPFTRHHQPTANKQLPQLLLQQMAAHFQLTNASTVSDKAPPVPANGFTVIKNVRPVYKNCLTFCKYLLRVVAIGGTVLADDSPRIDNCPPFTSVI